MERKQAGSARACSPITVRSKKQESPRVVKLKQKKNKRVIGNPQQHGGGGEMPRKKGVMGGAENSTGPTRVEPIHFRAPAKMVGEANKREEGGPACKGANGPRAAHTAK